MKNALYLLCCIVFIIGFPRFSYAQIISTYAGTGYPGNGGDNGPATAATFSVLTSMAIGGTGSLYINDQGNNCVRMVEHAAGIISTIAGIDSQGYDGDNRLATNAALFSNWGVAMDAAGNIYIADQDNHRVRKVNTAGVISTIAGTGVAGTGGDGGAATLAEIYKPIGIAADRTGNIFVSDQDSYTIRKINSSGIISTFAGIPGGVGPYGEGVAATSATLSTVYGLAVDTSGNLYICDAGNNSIRKVNTSGIITTVAGMGTAVGGYSGDNGAATVAALNNPAGVCADHSGNIYIADCNNNRIRKVAPSGIITTIAGNGTPGFGGDGGLATAAALNGPSDVVIDDSGNFFISDLNNLRIRKIKMINLLFFIRGHSQHFSVCENAIDATLDSVLSVMDYYTGLTESWSIVSSPAHGSLTSFYSATSTGDTLRPAGIFYTPQSGFTGTDSFRERVSDGILSDTTTVYISVNPLVIPAGGITGDSAVCPGSAITLNDTIAGGVWISSNGNANASFLPNDTTCIITGIKAGKDTITYLVSSACGTGRVSKIITINPLPDTGIISGASALCIGDSIILTESVPGGLWTANNANASVDPHDSATVVRSLNIGPDVIRYTVANPFCTAYASKAITIKPLPFVGAINGPPVLCMGSAITLTDSITGGVWTATNNAVAISQDITTGIASVLGISVGNDTILYTVNVFCGTATAIKDVVVDSLPIAPSIIEDQYILSVPAAYSSYQWTLNGTAVTGANQDTFIITEAGIYAVTVGNILGCTATSLPVNCPDCSPDEIQVYPNPSENMVNIKWCKGVIVKIMCMDGRIYETSSATNAIDLSYLPDGNYLLAMYDENGNKVKTKMVTKISQK